jgi:hypothetical protein
MIIGFGFGNFTTALLMLLITSFLSYSLFRALGRRQSRGNWNEPEDAARIRQRRREYYYEQRRKAREMTEKYDLSDAEIEKIIAEELDSENPNR